jgi:hypothetical protein
MTSEAAMTKLTARLRRPRWRTLRESGILVALVVPVIAASLLSPYFLQPGNLLGTTRSYQHSQRLGFHADPTGAVGLLCLRPARSGGLSAIVSAVAVHNELVDTRPDLARLLYEPWWFDRRTGDGPDSFLRQPVYTVDSDGGLITRYGPDYMRSAQRGAHVPPLTAEQDEALVTLDRLNHDPRFRLTMDLRPGDLQLLNNRVILHGRTAFADHPEPARRRHLLRLWLDQA